MCVQQRYTELNNKTQQIIVHNLLHTSKHSYIIHNSTKEQSLTGTNRVMDFMYIHPIMHVLLFYRCLRSRISSSYGGKSRAASPNPTLSSAVLSCVYVAKLVLP